MEEKFKELQRSVLYLTLIVFGHILLSLGVVVMEKFFP